MTRPTSVRIDLAALRNNYLYARGVHGGRALAVLKANAYGHGALASAHSLASVADGFAVAFLDEAVRCAKAGLRNPILVLEGCFNASELKIANELDLWLVVHQEEQIRLIEESRTGALQCLVEDRYGHEPRGFRRTDAASCVSAVAEHRARSARSRLMTHFARADETGRVDDGAADRSVRRGDGDARKASAAV